jgi:hypothetical protein
MTLKLILVGLTAVAAWGQNADERRGYKLADPSKEPAATPASILVQIPWKQQPWVQSGDWSTSLYGGETFSSARDTKPTFPPTAGIDVIYSVNRTFATTAGFNWHYVGSRGIASTNAYEYTAGGRAYLPVHGLASPYVSFSAGGITGVTGAHGFSGSKTNFVLSPGAGVELPVNRILAITADFRIVKVWDANTYLQPSVGVTFRVRAP